MLALGCGASQSASEATEQPRQNDGAEQDASLDVSDSDVSNPDATPNDETTQQGDPTEAAVTKVTVEGEPGAYTFHVTVRSPDTGCDQFADYWEVITEEGELVYRRILLHSHVDEQPFTRSGGPVPAQNNASLVVRAHLNTEGYGRTAQRGTAAGGFSTATLEAGFADDLSSKAPLPEGCAF